MQANKIAGICACIIVTRILAVIVADVHAFHIMYYIISERQSCNGAHDQENIQMSPDPPSAWGFGRGNEILYARCHGPPKWLHVFRNAPCVSQLNSYCIL